MLIRRMLTRFAKGEVSPLLEGSPDLVAYWEGARTLENFFVLRQGGVRRWEGTRFIAEVKDSSKDTVLVPFVFNVDDTAMLELGHQYLRIYAHKAQVTTGGVPVEVATPYQFGDLRLLHTAQSGDVLYLFHELYRQRLLKRYASTTWTLTEQDHLPPPTDELDFPFAASIALESNDVGSNVQCRASAPIFLAADVGRLIVAGPSKAEITSLVDSYEVLVRIDTPFTQLISSGPSTLSTTGTAATTGLPHGLSVGQCIQLTSGAQASQMRYVAAVTGSTTFTLDVAFTADQSGATYNVITPLTASNWWMRRSPNTTLDPSIRGPVGATCTLVAGSNAFRPEDIGRYIRIYAGLVRIDSRSSTFPYTTVSGPILREMTGTSLSDPPAASAGTWTLETSLWAGTYPRTGEFFQGRLYQASTQTRKTSFWGSRTDDYDNYAAGELADDGVDYTIASREVNQLQWLVENQHRLWIGTSGAELTAESSDAHSLVIGGNVIPLISRLATNGSAPIQPVSLRRTVVFVDRTRRKLIQLAQDVDAIGELDRELTAGAEHITASPIRQGRLGFVQHPDPRLYFVRDDGVLVGATLFPEQKVTAFARRTTLGTFEAVATIPGANGQPDQCWVIVKRTINGVTRRYVELFEPQHEGLVGLPTQSLQTDCAVVLTGVTGVTVTGLGHLEGMTVVALKNGSSLGTFVVSGGTITLPNDAALVPSDRLEVGLPYTSTLTTFRPAVPQQVTEGLPRTWRSLWVRVDRSKGGRLNGERLQYPPTALDTWGLYTGDLKVHGQGIDTDGVVSLVQDEPYPLTILGIFGSLEVGDHD